MPTQDQDRLRRIAALAAFLGRTRAASRAEIFAAVEGYRGRKEEAARRLLRRDLDQLEAAFRVQVSYNEHAERYELQRDRGSAILKLTPEQKVALSIAIRFAEADPAQTVIEAAADLPLLETAGWALPSLTLDENGERLLEAILSRREVEFEYRNGAGEITQRRVQPWVLTWRGERYLTGHDLDRGATRHFRLGRIRGVVQTSQDEGTFEPPDDPASVQAPWESNPDREAKLRVAESIAWVIARRFGVDTSEEDGELVVRVPYRHDASFASYLAGFGAEIEVLGPQTLRAAMLQHLEAALVAMDAGA